MIMSLRRRIEALTPTIAELLHQDNANKLADARQLAEQRQADAAAARNVKPTSSVRRAAPVRGMRAAAARSAPHIPGAVNSRQRGPRVARTRA
jgi:hypothetical protein